MRRTSSTKPARTTSERVYFFDRLSQAVITVGGVGVLAAVLGLCVYLGWVVAPLFAGAKVSVMAESSVGATTAPQSRNSADRPRTPLVSVFDEDGRAMLDLEHSGAIRVISARSGIELASLSLPTTIQPTAASEPQRGGLFAVGFADGSVRLGSIGFFDALLADRDIPADARTLQIGGEIPFPEKNGLIVRVSEDQFRLTAPSIELGDPLKLTLGTGGVKALDFKTSTAGQRFVVALRDDGTTTFASVKGVRGLAAKKPRDSLVESLVSSPSSSTEPASARHWLFVTSDGTSVFSLSNSGRLARFAVKPGTPAVISPADIGFITPNGLVPGLASASTQPASTRITAAAMLQGGLTLVVGDSNGHVRTIMVGQDPTASTPDQRRLVQSSDFVVPGSTGRSAISALGMSTRDRIVGIGSDDGSVVVRHMTSQKVVARMNVASGNGPVSRISILPKGDGVFAENERGAFRLWSLEGGHPEASATALFTPLIYEGQTKPAFTYQASGGNEDAESKTSLVPLIFGTLKATLVAMFFAVPIAVFAAIYTSEFLAPGARRIVKPTIEMMASLPSVVLGFIAAMVVAPFVAGRLGMVLGVLFVLPIGLLLSAHAWQMLPPRTVMLVGRKWRVVLIGACMAGALAFAGVAGPWAERALFKPTVADRAVGAGMVEDVPNDQWPAWVGQRASMSGDDQRALRRAGLFFIEGKIVRPIVSDVSKVPFDAAGAPSLVRWLNGSIGDARPGWVLVLILPFIAGCWISSGRFGLMSAVASRAGRNMRSGGGGASRTKAVLEFVRFVGSVIAGLAFTLLAAEALTRAGWDPRDSILGPFSQRNALVVGLIMGFAIIPIIFTISEDSLRSVPATLRSASLGVGATPWQTAIRIVLPAAGSGVFSACMIGLGRAVGETMIVLMATGNTPDMSPNLFSGFRTLAANIAVELPESEKGGTHYRVLFLCGLTLFAMTFIINTTAEVVRQRFRKRTAAL